jgi:hypothetical protein
MSHRRWPVACRQFWGADRHHGEGIVTDVGAGQWPGDMSLLKPGFPVFVIALKHEVAN